MRNLLATLLLTLLAWEMQAREHSFRSMRPLPDRGSKLKQQYELAKRRDIKFTPSRQTAPSRKTNAYPHINSGSQVFTYSHGFFHENIHNAILNEAQKPIAKYQTENENFSGFSKLGKPIINPDVFAPCNGGYLRNAHGYCVEPTVSNNLYIFTAPPAQINSYKPPVIPKPKLHVNYVFVKSPEIPLQPKPIVVPPPQEKTNVYVLNKRPTLKQEIIEFPASPIEPEVFFVSYKDGDNQVLPGGVDLETVLEHSAFIEQRSEGTIVDGNYQLDLNIDDDSLEERTVVEPLSKSRINTDSLKDLLRKKHDISYTTVRQNQADLPRKVLSTNSNKKSIVSYQGQAEVITKSSGESEVDFAINTKDEALYLPYKFDDNGASRSIPLKSRPGAVKHNKNDGDESSDINIKEESSYELEDDVSASYNNPSVTLSSESQRKRHISAILPVFTAQQVKKLVEIPEPTKIKVN